MQTIAKFLILAGVVVILVVILSPIASVLFISLSAKDNLLHYVTIPAVHRYIVNTIVVAGGVAILSTYIGVGTAWLVSNFDFPLRRILELGLFFPLAIPGYVGAYALVDFFEFAGPFQSALRNAFGWQLAADYYFPHIRSRGGAILVLSLSLYPYIYLLTRAAMLEQSRAATEVASTLGASQWSRLFRVVLPLVRPGIMSGLVIVMMETVADFGVVEYFAVQTLTTAIYSFWLDSYDVGGAAQISVIILIMVVLIVSIERLGRGKASYYQSSYRPVATHRRSVRGLRGVLTSFVCLLPILLGFVLPTGVMTSHAIRNGTAWLDQDLAGALVNTLYVGGAAALLTVASASFLVAATRSLGTLRSNMILSLTTIGYATPGVILGLGILLPMAAFDHALADMIVHLFDTDPGLLLTGSAFALCIAFCVRFFALAQGAADTAMGRISPNIVLVSRSLGRSAAGTFLTIKVPIMRGSLLVALLLVFVDCVKELPATLLLRPFNFNTLATHVYEQASLENIGEAAPAALLVTLVGCLGVALIARTRN